MYKRIVSAFLGLALILSSFTNVAAMNASNIQDAVVNADVLTATNAVLSMDDDLGIINGLDENWMISTDDRETWGQGREGVVFAPGTTVLVATFDQDVIDAIEGLPTWDENTVYLTGDRVVFEGFIWRARHWTQGSEPIHDPAEPWNSEWDRLGPHVTASMPEWNATQIYWRGDSVVFEGSVWVARHWTQGVEPGDAWDWEYAGPFAPILGTDVEPEFTFAFTEWDEERQRAFLDGERERLLSTRKIKSYLPSWSIYCGEPESGEVIYCDDYEREVGETPVVQSHEGFRTEMIDYSLITHVVYSFILIAPEDGDPFEKDDSWYGSWSVRIDDEWAFGLQDENGATNANAIVPSVVRDIAAYEDTYFVFSLGGWTNSENDQFTYATNTPEKIDALADELVEFMLEWGFDGIDLDWEFPRNETDRDQFLALVRALRERLDEVSITHRQRFQLSAATTPNPALVPYIAPDVIADYLDTINFMAYDYNGAWQAETGHNAPLFDYEGSIHETFNINAAVEAYLAAGIPRGQLLIGLPFYSRSWNDVPNIELVEGLPGLGVPGTTPEYRNAADGLWGGGTDPYYRMEELLLNPDYVRFWDDEAKAPFLFNATTGRWISYDDEESIGYKLDYIVDGGFAGSIIWTMTGDTRDDRGVNDAHHLGRLVADRLLGPVTPPVEEPDPETSEFLRAVTNMRIENGHLYVDVERAFFEGDNRVILDLNGSYRGEFHRASVFHSARAYNSQSDQVTIRLARNLAVGDVLRVRLSSGRPGQSSNVLEYKTLTVTQEMLIGDFLDAVTNMRIENGHLHVDVERAFFEDNNRVMFDLNGSYEGEFHNARVFYAVRAHNRQSDYVTIQFARDLSVGDVVRVRLSSGRPGQASNVLEYKTLTVTQEMLEPPVTETP